MAQSRPDWYRPEERKCRACDEWKPLAMYPYIDGEFRPGSRRPKCRPCHNASNVERLRTQKESEPEKYAEGLSKRREQSRERYRRSIEKERKRFKRRRANGYSYRPQDPVKEKARLAVNNAVKAGKLVKPKKCEDCGEAGKRLHGHHEDYNKALEVNWVCAVCHGVRHRKPAYRAHVGGTG